MHIFIEMNLYQNLITCSLFIISIGAQFENGNETSEFESKTEKSVILSRRKRFLVFPEGSSFQLVFCTTYPMLVTISDIFLYGSTAALAWELPQDPYSPFNHKADPLHRRMDTKVIYYTDEDGRIIDKKPYKRRPIINPAFAKRSVDSQLAFKKGTDEKFKMDRKQMHNSENKREYLKSEGMEARSVEFHRSSRASLYQKIETMLHGLGVNGKHCVLKTLCLVGKTQNNQQGAFFQELLRAIFTLPEKAGDEQYKKYDEALLAHGSCEDSYSECDEMMLDSTSPRFNY